MKGNYRSMSVANYIVNKAIEYGEPVSNLKLQKLLYYVQAASLVEHNKPMFNEYISAWTYGPVVETVYHAFKYYVAEPIDALADNSDFESIDGDDLDLIDSVVDSYRGYSALEMVRKTHNEDPWYDAYHNEEPYIQEKSISDYYNKYSEKIRGDKTV